MCIDNKLVEKLIRIVSHVRVLVEHARRGESFEIDLIIREAGLVCCYLKHKFQQHCTRHYMERKILCTVCMYGVSLK